jgi:hypothetical protein
VAEACRLIIETHLAATLLVPALRFVTAAARLRRAPKK